MMLEEAILDVGPGWESLVREGWAAIQEAAGEPLYVKEKHGRLVFVVPRESVPEHARTRAFERLQTIQDRSVTTCELCGRKGEPTDTSGWWKTICPYHAMRIRTGESWGDLVEELRPLATGEWDMHSWQHHAGEASAPDDENWGRLWRPEADDIKEDG